MKLISLFFFSAVIFNCGGISQASVDCSKPLRTNCPVGIPLYFHTSEHLEYLCNTVFEVLDCWISVQVDCFGSRNTGYFKSIGRMIRHYEEICSNSTTLKQGNSKESWDCSKPVSLKCAVAIPLYFQTPEQLDRLCKNIFDVLDCKLSSQVACHGSRDIEKIEYILRKIRYYEEICSNSTTLQQDIMDNMPCIRRKKAIPPDCYSFRLSEERVNKDKSNFLAHGIPEMSKHENFTNTCIYLWYVYACEVLKFKDECGPAAVYTYTEVLKKALYPLNYCHEEILEYIPQIFELLKDSVYEVINESAIQQT